MSDTEKTAKRSWLRRDRKRIASGFGRILLIEFDELEKHRRFTKRVLSSRTQALDSREKKIVNGIMDEEERVAYYDYMYDEYVEISETIPRIQWYSEFLVVYSTFEHLMNKLCQIVQGRSGFDLSFKDLSGQGITRARNYLVKVAGVETPFNSRRLATSKTSGRSPKCNCSQERRSRLQT